MLKDLSETELRQWKASRVADLAKERLLELRDAEMAVALSSLMPVEGNREDGVAAHAAMTAYERVYEELFGEECP